MYKEFKNTFVLALPLIVGNLGQVLLGVIDSMMVGQLGPVELAASSFANNIFHIPLIILFGVSSAISINVAQAFGAGRPQETGLYWLHGLYVLLALSFGIVFCLIFLSFNLSLFNQPLEVTETSKAYFQVITWSLIPIVVFQGARQFCDGHSNTLAPTVILSIGLLINVFLNWILIFGKLGFPEYGLVGAGYATFISRVLIVFIVLHYIFRSQKYKTSFSNLKARAYDLFYTRAILRIGIPSGMQYMFEVVAFSTAGFMMGWISTQALAAHQIAISLATMTFVSALGISIGTSIRIGQSVGKKDIALARKIGVSSSLFTLMGMSLFAVLFILLRYQLPQFFIDDIEVITMAASLLIVAGIFQIFDGLQAVMLGALRGFSDVRIPTLITFLSWWVMAMPLCYALAFVFNFDHIGVWAGLASTLAFASIFLMIRFHIISKNQI